MADIGGLDIYASLITGLGPIFSFSSSGSKPFTLWIWWIWSSIVILALAALVAASTLEV